MNESHTFCTTYTQNNFVSFITSTFNSVTNKVIMNNYFKFIGEEADAEVEDEQERKARDIADIEEFEPPRTS